MTEVDVALLADAGRVVIPRQERVVRERSALKSLAFKAAGGAAAGIAGAAAFGAAYFVVNGSPIAGGHLARGAHPYVGLLCLAAAVRGVLSATSIDRGRRDASHADEVVAALKRVALGSLVLVVVAFFWRGDLDQRTLTYSRLVFLVDWLIASELVVGVHLLFRSELERLRARGHNVRTVIVIGGSGAAADFMDGLARHPEAGYQLLAHIPQVSAHEWLATVEALARRSRVDEVVLAADDVPPADIANLLRLPGLARVELRAVPGLFGLRPAKVSIEPAIGGFPLLTLFSEPLGPAQRAMKRSVDVLVSCLALFITSPMILAAALAVRVSSRGPVLFRQTRVGMDGREFEILKFRTMRHGADTSAHEQYVAALIRGEEPTGPSDGVYKLDGDSRITPVGRVLRRFSVDEVPQLLNVLRGDMSLVGPRPALPYEVELYEDWQKRRLEVRPGITGLWQVGGRNRLTFDEMVQLDLQYIDTWSPAVDIRALMKTPVAVLRHDSR